MSRRARLFGLVSLLSGRRHISLREIADRFEITERTAYRDLAALDEIPVPVIHDSGGYPLLEGATVRALNLTGEERALLLVSWLDGVDRRQLGEPLGRHPARTIETRRGAAVTLGEQE